MNSQDRAREMVDHLASELQHGARVLASDDNHPLTNSREIARAFETNGRVIIETPLPREAFREIGTPAASQQAGSEASQPASSAPSNPPVSEV